MRVRHRFILRAALALGLTALVCLPLRAAETISGLTAVSADMDLARIKPGLAVKYYFSMFRRVHEIQEWAKYKDGKPGEPLRMLNYHTGTGEVLTSGSDDGVGADAEPGWYPLSLWYFERKNTSTLELYWLKPGEEGRLSFVPADALAHAE